MVLVLNATRITNLAARLSRELHAPSEQRARIEDTLMRAELEREFTLQHYEGISIPVTERFYGRSELAWQYYHVFNGVVMKTWEAQVSRTIRHCKLPFLEGHRVQRGIFIAAGVERQHRRLFMGQQGVPRASLTQYTLKGVLRVRSADAARFLGIRQDRFSIVRDMREVKTIRVEEGHGYIYLYSLPELERHREVIYDYLLTRASRLLRSQTFP